MTARAGTALREAAAWLAVLALAAAVMAARGYRTRDADSRLYAEIAAWLAERPDASWIAPQFPPGWFMRGPFREHPAGLFAPPALLGRSGYPPAQAAYVVNALYQVLTLVAIRRLVREVGSPLEGRTLMWLLQLLPIAFTYRIRANHEQAVVLCVAAALVGLELSRRAGAWGLLTVLALVALLLVKGVFVAVGLLACGLWLLARGGSLRGWAILTGGAVAVALAAAAYDVLYREATGEGFWRAYLGRQMGVAAAVRPGETALEKAENVVWYASRLVWFAFPWSLVLVASAWWRGEGEARDRGAVFAAAFALVSLAVFSLSDRRADRYLFPAYYALGAAGAVAALRRWAGLRRLAERVDRGHPYAAPALWLVLFALHNLAPRLGIPTLKLWAG